MTSSRRLSVLLAILAISGAYYAWTLLTGDSGPAGGVTGSRGRTSVSARASGAEIEPLATAKLDRESSVYRQGRDLFRYEEAPRARPTPPPTPRPRPPAQRPAPAPTKAEPRKPQPPPVDVVYLGSFGRPGRRIAVFSDEENVYNAVVGDVIKEKFILVTIGYESADVKFVGFPEATAKRLAVGGLR